MVQILENRERKSGAERFLEAISKGGNEALDIYKSKKMQEKQNQFELDKLDKKNAADLEKAEKIERLKGEQKKSLITEKNQEKTQGINKAKETVNRMRDIRSKGNLGMFSHARSLLSNDTTKDRGEYETLGKSLIQYATTIPIRNRLEFETLAEKLYDPNIRDKEAEGILDAMERILQTSEENPEEETNVSNMSENNPKNKRPVSAFWK